STTVTWIRDLNGPSITANGTTTTLGCNPSASDIDAALGTATATDGCSTTTITAIDGTISTTSCSASQTRTFTARDACGNTATTSRTITWVADQNPPVITITGAVTTLGCNPSASDINAALGTATASDGCSAASITSSDGAIATTSCNASRTRTFTAIDACGNTATASTTVTETSEHHTLTTIITVTLLTICCYS